MNYDEIDIDSPLTQNFRSGEESAFDTIFRSYYPALCEFASTYLKDNELSKDIVQDSFLQLWKKRSVVNSINYLQSYLYTVVRNRCIDYIRRKKVSNKRFEQFKYLTEVWSQVELNELIHCEVMRKIYDEIAILPPKMQQVFRMYYLEGKKYQEIAKEMNSSYDTVRQQKARALELLKGRVVIVFELIALLKNFYNN